MAVLCLAFAAPARAADVSMNLSTDETFVGVPVVVQITIKNAKTFEAPAFPDVAGAKVASAGVSGPNTITQIINGRVTRMQSVAYIYQVTPTKLGRLGIPPIRVKA
ncbi:MAG: BatD family protein, partial [Phycisphaerae bacterium]